MSMHDPYQKDFNKSHHFGFAKTPHGPMAIADRMEERARHQSSLSPSRIATLLADPGQSTVPAWVALDRKVLCFSGYFREAMPESKDELDRIRHVQILYYLVDGAMSIIEPPTEDSGTRQGTMLNRMQVSKDGTPDGEIYGLTDLFIGNELLIYGKVFRITDCDIYTRNFLNKYGYAVGFPEEPPKDRYTQMRMEARMDKYDFTKRVRCHRGFPHYGPVVDRRDQLRAARMSRRPLTPLSMSQQSLPPMSGPAPTSQYVFQQVNSKPSFVLPRSLYPMGGKSYMSTA
jgi:hypothetical protein